jgi:TetR/AcrR family transcriptional regulator
LSPADHATQLIERDKFERALRDLVREGIVDGSIVTCDPKLVVFAMLGAINWIPKWFRQRGEWSPGQLTGALVELFDRMLSRSPSASLTANVGEAGPGP